MEDPKAAARAYVKFFGEIDMDDVASVGGKNASLGEMFQNLTKRGIPVPDGFAVTAAAYWRFLDASGLRNKLRDTLAGLDVRDIDALAACGLKARQLILGAEMPADLGKAVDAAYDKLCKRYG